MEANTKTDTDIALVLGACQSLRATLASLKKVDKATDYDCGVMREMLAAIDTEICEISEDYFYRVTKETKET